MSALPSATPDPLPNAFSFLKGTLEDVQAMPYPDLSKLLKTYGVALEAFNATTPTLIANPLAEVSGSQPQGPFQAPPPPPELDNNEANNPGGVRPMGAAAASAAAPQPWVPPANNAQNESSALLIRRALALQILKPFLAATQFALDKDHPFTWSPLDVKPPPRFFSEVVAFPWEGQLVFCGPYFSSGGPTTSRDPPTTVVKTLSLETLELRDVECSGQSPNPFRLFKRMPVHFVEGRHLYLLYSDQQVGTCVLTRLNLDTWAWEPLETTGTRPPSRDFVDGAFFMGRLYISQSRGPEATSRENAVYSLDLASLVWQELRCTGAAPDCPNGSSLLYKGHLCVFSKDGDFLYQLSLATLEWHKFHLARRLPDFSARRHSHLFQLHEEDLIAARACDGYQLLSFNMETKAWRFVETLGRRPGRAKTEVTCVVHEDVLYCIGGQIDSHNHILSLLLGPRRPRKKQPVQPPPRHWVSSMRKSPFYDVAFVLDDGSCHTAHKSVLVARSEYFATMLQSGMKESTQAEIRLSNISGPTFGYVLDYIYEALDMDALPAEADFFDFFNAAMLFRIPELLDHIARHLLESIDAENALSLLALFHTASNDSLSPEYVRRVVSFIVEHGQEVAKQPSFVQMCKETPELAQVLFATLSKPLPVASSSGSSASGSLKRKRSDGF